LAQFDALSNQAMSVPDYSGHGTHVASIVASRKTDNQGRTMGAAPGARFVMVRAFDSRGQGTYASVIGGINWIVANRSRFDIRVLNCSFSAPVHSWYWEDPLNRAVMAAWKSGIVVVVSAGNSGPSPMSVGVPGNVPYVITVGAMTDSFTPGVASDDRLASFSAAGPTFEGFVKPDLVAPGGHMLGHMDEDQRIARAHPEFETTSGSIFEMSGTSQAAAVISGVAALMLQVNPDLSPDEVKCGLMASARAAQKPDGTSPYSVFQQGAGVVDAWDAVYGATSRCANNGLDVAQDLAGTRHYAGPAAQDSLGNYVLLDQTGSGTTWNGTYSRTGGYPWSDGYPWSSGYPWSNGYPWSTGYPWSNGYPWSTGYPWSSGRIEPTNINSWVPQE
jgi:serine protease AprX